MKVLVVGTGFGCRIQIPALRAAGFEVVGLVGAHPRRTAERARDNAVERAFADLGQALSETHPDVVAISTPPDTHHALTLQALAHGRHVLCEKPFATSLAEAEEMLHAAERAGVVHAMGHEFRFFPQRALIGETLASGAIGEPKVFAAIQFNSYLTQFGQDLSPWWFDPASGGGWLTASGSHVIDQVRHDLGEIAGVSAVLPRVASPEARVEDAFIIQMTLASGAQGTVQQTGSAFGPPSDLYRVAGASGSLWSEGGQVHLATADGVRQLAPPDEARLPEAEPGTDPRQASAEWRRLTAVELRPYTQLCRHMRARIEGRPAPSPATAATFVDGVACTKVIDAVRASAASGGAPRPV